MTTASHYNDVPANEIERLAAVRSLMPSQVQSTPELDALTTLARMVFQTPMAAVTIVDEDWQHIAASAGLEVVACSREQSMCTHVVRTGHCFVVPDLTEDEAFRTLPYVEGDPQFRFYAGTPIELEPGLTVGALCVLDTAPRRLSAQEMETLRNFGTVAGGLLRLERSNILLGLEETALKTAAMTDPLTGFYNRKAITSIVDGAITAAIAENREIGVLYMDLDGFKKINDQHGHPVGDAVLVEAARRIRSVIRADDTPIRLGGDEFALFLHAPSSVRVLESVAERLIQVFREPFQIEGKIIQARASIGVAVAPRDAASREELTRNVDAALYTAKARGRDRYVFFDRTMSNAV
ncbi:sensor domain-containing diguanylate cyclase [Mesorhizobium sp. KR1-2]|uniref:sensor domain-containing diguanylate cyclase n=1 Tax=Mesorhizobium sp. KR1-2 TaxID=3156609 RepID=UPI0032B444E3